LRGFPLNHFTPMKADAALSRKSASIRVVAIVSPDPVESAKAANLRYVTDSTPGISRRKRGTGFEYIDPLGKVIRDPDELQRFKSLAIPPAWREVWICPLHNGHLQATGRDIKGRKQHRYHPRWREVRDENKYGRILEFAKALPVIREKVDNDLRLPGLPRDKILATVVRLLETSHIRVGNEEYARQNKSYGLATLRNCHVNVSGSTIRFEFRGKSGVEHALDINDRRLAKIIKRCQDLPGYELFQYLDQDGERHTIDSSDVNEYIRQIAGEEFSTKDFRTWAGTVLAARALQQFETAESNSQSKRNILQAVEAVAKKLGNTKAVCRKCYIHPAVIDAYTDGSLLRVLNRRVKKEVTESLHKLEPEEAAVLGLFRTRLKKGVATRNKEAQKAATNGSKG
jgi:DNA topoisomerase I